MNDADKKLVERIEALEERIKNTENDLARAVKVLGGFDDALRRHCELNSRDIADAFDRIINIEVKFFPNLADDIVDLHKIIGDGENKADNPLDHRKR